MAIVSMTPSKNIDPTSFEIVNQPSYTYRMIHDKKRIVGNLENELEAVAQACFKILSTERYQHVIYDWDYGIQTIDLFGMPRSYVEVEFKRRSKEALLYDDRVSDVGDYSFEWDDKGNCHVTMTVTSVMGDFPIIAEVINNA